MNNELNPQKTRVGLVQINNSFSGQNYLPLSVGMLQAYVQKNLTQAGDFEFLNHIYRRMPVDVAVEQLGGAHVVFFSAYVWNFRISLEIAKSLKSQSPKTTIIFGGPQVPDAVESFLRDNPYVDIACHGEGEQSALAILENLDLRDWHSVPGISFLDGDGALFTNSKAPRNQDLSIFPSPYLEGVFGPLMDAHPDEGWIALWETNRGCPFSCAFCDWGSAVQSKLYSFDMDRLNAEVEWFAAHKIEFVFCCDANFGILPRDIEIAQHIANTKIATGYPHALSVQNTKNATDRAYQVQKILSDAGLNKGVDIALQSLDPNTLKSIKRSNISLDSYQELANRFTRDEVETYTDLILGLPGETYTSFADGVSAVIDNGQHNRIQFANLSILPNAEMGDPEYQRKYGMITVESKTVNLHGSLSESESEIYETQILVVGTESMPKEDWIKARVFAWMAGFLHFDKVLQIPSVLMHEISSISYRDLIETFLSVDAESFPVLNDIRLFFQARAQIIQDGGPEYIHSEEWLNIWWPIDEYVLIRLCVEDKLHQFYQEAEKRLFDLAETKNVSIPEHALHQAIDLNRSLLKVPFQTEDIDLELTYNIQEFWLGVRAGTNVSLKNEKINHHIDRTTEEWSSWQEWCQEVIWYGNKKGAYLYGNRSSGSQLAGHY